MDWLILNSKNILNLWLTMQLQTGLFVLVILAIDMSLRKSSPRFRYLLWCTALVKAFLPPIVALPVAADSPIARMTMPVLDVRVPVAHAANGGIPLEAMLVFGLVAVASALLLLVLYRSTALHLHLRDAAPLQHDAWESGPPVLTARGLPSPVAVGVLRPRIYVTEEVVRGPQNILRAVLHHERAHVRRRDGVVVFLQTLVQIFYVLNPLVWLMNLRLFRYREQICDEEALKQTGTRPSDYGRLLLQYAEAQPSRIVQVGTCFFETRRGFVQRINQLFLAMEGKNMNRWNRFAVLILITAIVPLSWRCSDDKSEDNITYKEEAFVQYDKTFEDESGDTSGVATLGNVSSELRYEKEGKLKSMQGARIVGGLEALSKHVRYPEEAKQRNLQGTVVVEATVSDDGPCDEARVIKSVHPLLDEAALIAVRAVQFKAARRNGKVLGSELAIPIKFRLQ